MNFLNYFSRRDLGSRPQSHEWRKTFSGCGEKLLYKDSDHSEKIRFSGRKQMKYVASDTFSVSEDRGCRTPCRLEKSPEANRDFEL